MRSISGHGVSLWSDENVLKLMVVMVVRAQSLLTFATLCTVARQAPLSMGLSRQEYWSGLPCPPPGNLPQGSKLCLLSLLHWQAVSLPLVPPGKPWMVAQLCKYIKDH